jgi:hypothetical protein
LVVLALVFDGQTVYHAVCLELWDAATTAAKRFRGLMCESRRVEAYMLTDEDFESRGGVKFFQQPYADDVKVILSSCEWHKHTTPSVDGCKSSHSASIPF